LEKTMTKNNARKKAARARAAAERSSYVRAQRLQREAAAEQAPEPRPDGPLRAPLAEELVWARVRRPAMPLVYLDLNHYINIAKALKAEVPAASSTKVLPGYVELAAAARAAKTSGRAMFPLSNIHFMELSKVKDPQKRADVAAAMEELSDFNYILDRVTLAQLEMDAGLALIYGAEKSQDEDLPLIAPSFAHGFGRSGNLTVHDAAGNDTSGAVRDQMGAPAFTKLFADMNLEMERAMLRGPSNEEIPELLARGFDPEVFRRGQQSRLGFELETKQILIDHPEWRRGRLRDLISGRDVVHEWMDLFVKLLLEREEDGLPHELPSESEMPGFWAAMPQVQVAISIKTRYHRNLERNWKTNDICDIDAMSIAYPYCDAVFTDRDARAAIVDNRDLRRIPTFTPKRPEELTAWLDGLPVLADPAAMVPVPGPTG
jgi:hypothetical protein